MNGELNLFFDDEGKAKVLNEDYTIYCENEKAFEKVKEAIEKQKPKRVEIKTSNIMSRLFYYCSNCNERLMDSMSLRLNIHSLPKYCSGCGQALDWLTVSE